METKFIDCQKLKSHSVIIQFGQHSYEAVNGKCGPLLSFKLDDGRWYELALTREDAVDLINNLIDIM